MKYYWVSFYRGQNYWYEERNYVFVADSDDSAKIKIDEYKNDSYKGWDIRINEIDFSKSNPYFISGIYC